MDDIWDTGVCDDLSRIFPDDGNGSRIILTTRLQDVATYGENSSPPHEMRLMHENQGLLSTSQIFSWLSGLRYLVLDCFVELPAAVSNLENLQTLIINAFEDWVRLPREIWRMQQLRHLVSTFDQLPCPQGATSFPLENLQTLSRVSNLNCTYRFVKMMPDIKKLGILYSSTCEFEQSSYLVDDFISSNPSRYYHGHLENLEHLHRLEELKVQVYPGIKGMFNPIFPQSLKKLSLRGWILPSWRDMTIVGSLPNLQVLKLRDLWCQDDEWETTEDEFGSLRFLVIESSGLRKWMTGSDHFPKLKKLLLHHVWRRSRLMSEIFCHLN